MWSAASRIVETRLRVDDRGPCIENFLMGEETPCEC
jgi:hypothetical protein